MSSFHYTAQAEADLDQITDYYSATSPAAGLRVLNAIEARCRQLANHPRMGRVREDLGPGVRSSTVLRYVIFFRATTDGIDVLRVLHGARDIGPEMFDNGGPT
jgi:toxin ParE1/3/4